jgi:hypothetical protein
MNLNDICEVLVLKCVCNIILRFRVAVDSASLLSGHFSTVPQKQLHGSHFGKRYYKHSRESCF